MIRDELILRSLLAVMEGQRKLAEVVENLSTSGCCGITGNDKVVREVELAIRVSNPEAGRHEETTYEDIYEPVTVKKGGRVVTERRYKGFGPVTRRYDLLTDLIRDELEGKK
jgi:hypothetical protein